MSALFYYIIMKYTIHSLTFNDMQLLEIHNYNFDICYRPCVCFFYSLIDVYESKYLFFMTLFGKMTKRELLFG